MVVGSLSVRRRDRATGPRKLKDQRRMQRLRARAKGVLGYGACQSTELERRTRPLRVGCG